jgi:hypothetical protein
MEGTGRRTHSVSPRFSPNGQQAASRRDGLASRSLTPEVPPRVGTCAHRLGVTLSGIVMSPIA